MIILFVVVVWLSVANAPSQLALVGFGVFIRMAYMDISFPRIPASIYFLWILIGILTYIFGEQSAEQAIMIFLKVSLSAFLLLHLSKQVERSPLATWPLIGEYWLYFKRAWVILPKKLSEMALSNDQRLSWIRRSTADQPLLRRQFRIATFRISSILGLFSSVLQQTTLLVERQGAVMEARGEFPKGGATFFSYPSPGIWYAPIVGDILLFILFAAPVVAKDTTLVPSRILDGVRLAWSVLGL